MAVGHAGRTAAANDEAGLGMARGEVEVNGRLLAAAALLHPFASVAGLEPGAEKLEEADAALARLQELAGTVGSERGALAGVVLEERDVCQEEEAGEAEGGVAWRAAGRERDQPRAHLAQQLVRDAGVGLQTRFQRGHGAVEDHHMGDGAASRTEVAGRAAPDAPAEPGQ